MIEFTWCTLLTWPFLALTGLPCRWNTGGCRTRLMGFCILYRVFYRTAFLSSLRHNPCPVAHSYKMRKSSPLALTIPSPITITSHYRIEHYTTVCVRCQSISTLPKATVSITNTVSHHTYSLSIPQPISLDSRSIQRLSLFPPLLSISLPISLSLSFPPTDCNIHFVR